MPTAVSAALIVAIVLASSIIVLNAVGPIMRESAAAQAFDEGVAVLGTVDAAIRQLLVEGPGAKRSIDIALRTGVLVVNDERDEVSIEFEEEGGLFDPGEVAFGNIRVTSGNFVSAHEDDADGDGDTDLILENSALLFAMEKKGSAAQNVTINTSTLIPVIKNKRSGVNITPSAALRIDDSAATGNGNGYTQLSKSGSNIAEGEIRLVMNATNNVTYTALFRLRPNDDYIIIDVGNVTVPAGAL